jgi:hypothetical protein
MELCTTLGPEKSCKPHDLSRQFEIYDMKEMEKDDKKVFFLHTLASVFSTSSWELFCFCTYALQVFMTKTNFPESIKYWHQKCRNLC